MSNVKIIQTVNGIPRVILVDGEVYKTDWAKCGEAFYAQTFDDNIFVAAVPTEINYKPSKDDVEVLAIAIRGVLKIPNWADTAEKRNDEFWTESDARKAEKDAAKELA